MASTWPKDIDPSLWRDAEVIVRTSDDLNAIESVCKFLLDPQDAVIMLYERPKRLLHDLCRRKGIPETYRHHPASLVQAIVETIRGPSLSGQRWDVNWIVPAILSASTTKEIELIAEEFDTKIHSALCMAPFSDLVSFSIGRNSSISDFFDMMSNLFNELARRVESDDVVADLLLLQKELQHPLSRWVVSNATSSVPFPHPEPSDALQFLLDPIRKLFENQLSVSQILERLQILEARFKSRISDRRTLDDTPLSTDFTLWDSIRRGSSDHLARIHTDCVVSLFSTLSTRDVLQDLPGMKHISKNWSNLADDILICLNVDGKLTDVFMDLAKRLLDLQNVHSATAVGMGLWGSGFQCPPQWSTIWGVINPEGNFAGCIPFMDENHCLPCLLPYMNDPQSNLGRIFRFVKYDGRDRKREQKVGPRRKGFGQGVEQNIGHEKSIWEETRNWSDLWKLCSIKYCISRK